MTFDTQNLVSCHVRPEHSFKDQINNAIPVYAADVMHLDFDFSALCFRFSLAAMLAGMILRLDYSGPFAGS
jgi:hypothetical protein